MFDNFGNYSSARGKKASSRFTKLKAIFTKRKDDERKFMLEEREDGMWVRPIPVRGKP